MERPITTGRLTRRQFLVTGAAAVCAGCNGIEIEEFGGLINLGQPVDVVQTIRENNGFWYRPDARMWVTEFPLEHLERARLVYSSPELAGMEVGVVALHQKCPHLGCRVPDCRESQWFECPCHRSKYNQIGERRGGPAPRGMDRFAISLNEDGDVIVDTGAIIDGPPIGTNTTGQEPAGPSCI